MNRKTFVTRDKILEYSSDRGCESKSIALGRLDLCFSALIKLLYNARIQLHRGIIELFGISVDRGRRWVLKVISMRTILILVYASESS